MTTTAAPTTDYPDRLRYGAIAALAGTGFVYFTAETLPVGLLPQIASGLQVTPAQVGLLVTVYAAFAAAGAIPLTSLTLKVPRHVLIACLVAAYVVSQTAAALAPTFLVLVIARILTALAHGVFWSVMAPVAQRLGPRGQGGKAASLVMAGTTVGMVLGVPITTLLGQAVGWRAAYGVLAGAGTVALVGVIVFLPKTPVTRAQAASSMRSQFSAVRRLLGSRAITLVCAVTTLGCLGHYAAYTFTAPIVERSGHISGSGLSLLLLGYGAMGLAATVVVGRIVDRRPGAALIGCFTAVVLALVTLSITRSTVVTVIAVLVWGAGFSSVPLIVQQTAMRVAPQARDSASAIRQSAAQIGISSGSLVGGAILAAGDVRFLAPFGAVVIGVFTIVVIANRWLFPLKQDPSLAPVTGEIGIIGAPHDA
ncbi:MFS transporter [Frondihabitans sp. PhB188]|uniref:MFS transporter n=1 Tax=Frondihabitans sp. PhB188 TaxID=2485200 RepID=UPI00131510C9|nr:MFS transporter [Frondihabitans sp. PhB188]